MKILDLYCGEGGSAMGLHQAFPDAEIMGIDIHPQPRYPFRFMREDVLWMHRYDYAPDFIWASPPCQRYIRSGLVNKEAARDLVGKTRELLLHLGRQGTPWIIENVPGAPLKAGVMLCGSMFGLRIRRHRLFEASFSLPAIGPAPCQHHHAITGVYGHPHGEAGAWKGKKPMLPGNNETWSREMGIDWMSTRGLSQAIPPAYSRWLAGFILGRTTETMRNWRGYQGIYSP